MEQGKAGRIDPPHDRELAALEEMSAYNDIAVAAGLYYCAQQGICPPPWLVHRAAELMINMLKREKSQKRGRSGGRIARYRQDMLDFDRWDTVLQIRSLRQRTKEDLRTLSDHPSLKKNYGKNLEKATKWLRHGTFECASMSLKGSPAFASPVTVKKSYRRVQAAMRSRSAGSRYHLIYGDFFRRVGLDWPGTFKPGTKIVPFWDLTR